MQPKEFVGETLRQVVDGVKEAIESAAGALAPNKEYKAAKFCEALGSAEQNGREILDVVDARTTSSRLLVTVCPQVA